MLHSSELEIINLVWAWHKNPGTTSHDQSLPDYFPDLTVFKVFEFEKKKSKASGSVWKHKFLNYFSILILMLDQKNPQKVSFRGCSIGVANSKKFDPSRHFWKYFTNQQFSKEKKLKGRKCLKAHVSEFLFNSNSSVGPNTLERSVTFRVCLIEVINSKWCKFSRSFSTNFTNQQINEDFWTWAAFYIMKLIIQPLPLL